MTAVFRLAGVDYAQWKAMTRALLRTDFRLPLTTNPSSNARWRGWLGLVTVMALFGLGAALVVLISADVLLTGTLTLTYLSVMLGTTLLTQHGTTMLSTADYAILGSRPVTSRTFFAIRLTNVLFHALLLTTLTAHPVIAMYALAHGASAARAAAAAIAIYAWAVMVTLTLVASYTTLLRTVGVARFHRAVGYLQLLAAFFTYFGLMLSGRMLARAQVESLTMPDAWWLVLVPPAWFASYLELSAGTPNSTTLIRAMLSIGGIAALGYVLRGRLGLDYAGHLADLPVVSESTVSAAVHTPLFGSGEARAVAILVVAHFRHDLRVRMGILAIVPLVLLYVIVGSQDRSFDFIALAVLLFPAMLSQHLASTDAYQASWIYGVTPADAGRLVIALKNIAVVYFLLPFLVLVAAVFIWRLGDAGHALVHTTMLGLISHLALQGSIIISPRLPFALPPDKMRGNATLMGWLLVVLLGGQLAITTLERRVYVSSARTVAVFVMLCLITVALNRVVAWRARALGT